MRNLLVAATLAGSIAAGGLAVAGTSDECVSYSFTAPIVGTRQATKCSPPTPFKGTLSGGNCQGVPPLNVAACVTFTLHLP